MSTLPAGTEPGSLFLEACADKGPFAGRSLGGAACPHSLHTPPWEPMLLAVQPPPPRCGAPGVHPRAQSRKQLPHSSLLPPPGCGQPPGLRREQRCPPEAGQGALPVTLIYSHGSHSCWDLKRHVRARKHRILSFLNSILMNHFSNKSRVVVAG